jgi:hypothetical protein
LSTLLGAGLEHREQAADGLPMPVGACASRHTPRLLAVHGFRQFALAGTKAA